MSPLFSLEQADETNPHGPSKVQEHDLEYWDYTRQIMDSTGKSVDSFLFVELDRAEPRFELWQGTSLSVQRVFVS